MWRLEICVFYARALQLDSTTREACLRFGTLGGGLPVADKIGSDQDDARQVRRRDRIGISSRRARECSPSREAYFPSTMVAPSSTHAVSSPCPPPIPTAGSSRLRGRRRSPTS